MNNWLRFSFQYDRNSQTHHIPTTDDFVFCVLISFVEILKKKHFLILIFHLLAARRFCDAQLTQRIWATYNQNKNCDHSPVYHSKWLNHTQTEWKMFISNRRQQSHLVKIDHAGARSHTFTSIVNAIEKSMPAVFPLTFVSAIRRIVWSHYCVSLAIVWVHLLFTILHTQAMCFPWRRRRQTILRRRGWVVGGEGEGNCGYYY